jgi:hypothetical protein
MADLTAPPTLASPLTALTPRTLFQGRFIQIGGRSYSVSPDGNRFLMLQPTGDATPPVRLDVITNWFGEFARVAAGR